MAAKKTVGELVYKVIGDAKGLGITLAKSEASIKSFDKSVGKFSKKSIAAFVGMGVGVTALGATLISATRKAAAFESTIGDLATLVDGNTDAVVEMRDGILALTRTIPRTGEELGSAAYDVLSAGITDTSDALAVLEASGKLAVAGLGNTKQAVNLTTSAINAFKIPAQDAERVAGILFETVRAGKTTVAELAQSFGNVAAAEQGAGVSLEETQAATAALTTVGFRTATAQDRLKALFDEMTKSSGKLADGYTNLTGKSIEITTQLDGFKNVLDDLFEQTGNNTIAFKNLFSSTEAGGAAMQLVTGASDSYNDTLVAMEANSKALDSAFNTQADTTANKLALAQNNLNILLVELGEKILPIVNKALNEFLGLVDLFAGAGEATKKYNKELNTLDKQIKEINDDRALAIQGTEKHTEAERKAGEEAIKQSKRILLQQKKVDLLAEAYGRGEKKQEALNTLNKEFSGVLEIVEERTGKMLIKQKDLDKSLKNELDLLYLYKKSQQLAIKDGLEPFIKANEEARKVIDDETDVLKVNEDAISKARTELETFQTSMLGFIDTSRKAVDTLEDDLAQGFKKFGEGLAGTFKDSNKELASIVLGAEDEIIRLKKERRNADNSDQRKELRKAIKEQEAILDAREGFEERRLERLAAIRERLGGAGLTDAQVDGLLETQSLEDKIAEQRRLASLNEFELFEEQQVIKLESIVKAFLDEKELIEGKIKIHRELESELTSFLLEQDTVRTESIDKFAENAIAKYKDMASELSRAVSLQQQLNSLRSNPEQFQKGGHVGSGGGEVHAGEYVIPADLVSRFGGVISALEGERTGGGVDNSSVVNAPITINAQNSDGVDMQGIGREWAWQLGRL